MPASAVPARRLVDRRGLAQQGALVRPVPDVAPQLAELVHGAALLRHARPGEGDGIVQGPGPIAGDATQRAPHQPAGDQVLTERGPRDLGFPAGYAEGEDLALAIRPLPIGHEE